MKKLWLLLALPLVVACGSDSSPSSPSQQAPAAAPKAALFVVTETPSPIIAGGASNGFQNSASFTVSIGENAGVGGNVAFVNLTLRNATTGVELNTLQYSPAEIQQRASTNHIAAKGALNIPLGIAYTLALGGRQARLTIAVQLVDDLGNRTNQSIDVNII